MRLRNIILLTGGVLIIIILITIIGKAYFTNTLAPLGICKPGDKSGQGMGPKFCYTPTGFAGKPCDRPKDCGTGGYCALADKRKEKEKGICLDTPIGCYIWIDENGNYDLNDETCSD